MLSKKAFTVLLVSVFSTVVLATGFTYPAPEWIAPSPLYRVSILQNGSAQESFVYYTSSTHPAYPGLSTSYSTFSFDGEITVVITLLNGSGADSCIIRPKSKGIKATVEGNTITYTTSVQHMVSVEPDGNPDHALLLFAHPPEREIPAADDPNVIRFEPGVHKVDDFVLPEGKNKIYIAGGAYVKGRFDLRSDVDICGRGIVSGEDYVYKTNVFRSLVDVRGKVEGITIVNTPHYSLKCKEARFVKCISWYGQTDGVHMLENGLVEDCFFKVNDDAFKLYNSGLTVRNCVVWQLFTGAPFQFSWNLEGETVSDILVSGVDIIHNDWDSEHINRAVFNSVHGGGANLKNYWFEDIRVEGDVWRLMKMTLKRTRYGNAPRLGNITNGWFKNVAVEGRVLHANQLAGVIEDGDTSFVGNFVFENLQVNGQTVRDANGGGGWELHENTSLPVVFLDDRKGSVQKTEKVCCFRRKIPYKNYVQKISTQQTDVNYENSLLHNGDRVEFKLKNIEPGNYDVVFKVKDASGCKSECFVQLRLNDVPLGRLVIDGNETVRLSSVEVNDSGLGTLSMVCSGGGFAISSIAFVKQKVQKN